MLVHKNGSLVPLYRARCNRRLMHRQVWKWPRGRSNMHCKVLRLLDGDSRVVGILQEPLRELTSSPLPCESWSMTELRWCHEHRPRILTLSTMRSKRGWGREWEEEKRERGEGGNDRKRSNNERKMERERQVTTQWRKLCSLFHSFKHVRMKTKSKDLPFIPWAFEGRFNPNPSLSLFVL